MKQTYTNAIKNSKFKEFADFFLQQLCGSATFDEAFMQAAFTYRKHFKHVPYKNSQAFLSDFYAAKFNDQTTI